MITITNKTTRYIFWAIILIALFIRFYKLGAVPVSTYWDETAILVDAKTIAANGMDMHGNSWFRTMFPSYGDYKLPVYIWFAALSVRLVGVSEFAVRLPSALAGIGTVLVSGALAHQLFILFGTKKSTMSKVPKNWATLIGCGMMAITPWAILFSRTGFEGHLAQFFVSVSVLLLLHSPTRKWLLLPSILLGSLATYTYFSVRFVWPFVFTAGFVVTYWEYFSQLHNKKLFKKVFVLTIILLVSLGAYLLSLQPMVTSPLYAGSNQFRLSTKSILNANDYPLEANILREQAGNTAFDRLFFHRNWLMARELAKNIADNLDFSYLFLTGDPNLRHGTNQQGLFLLPMLPLLIWGIYVLGKEQPKILIFLVVWWLAALLPASVPEDTPHALRSLNGLVPAVLIISFGLLDIFATISVHRKKIIYTAPLGILLIAVASSAIFFIHFYFSIYPSISASEWQDGYKQLTLFLDENKKEQEAIYIHPFDNRLYLWMLAYGPYTASEIQELPKENDKVTSLENYLFDAVNWQTTSIPARRFMVVGPKDYIYDNMANAPYTIKNTKEIIGDGGQVHFVTVSYEK
jgi:4-amino-4-deoxy-L-arabinose transferase-like glycosyltransferase